MFLQFYLKIFEEKYSVKMYRELLRLDFFQKF